MFGGSRIATRLNDVSPVNFLIAFHRGCQHNPLEESAVSKGVGLARGHFENAACHGNERSSTCTGWGGERRGGLVACASTCHPSTCTWISFSEGKGGRGIVGGGRAHYADLKIGRKEHSVPFRGRRLGENVS